MAFLSIGSHGIYQTFIHGLQKRERFIGMTYPLDVLHYLLDVWPDHLCLFPESKWQRDHYMNSSIIDKHGNLRLPDESLQNSQHPSYCCKEGTNLPALNKGQVPPKAQALFSLNARRVVWQYQKWRFSLSLRLGLYSAFTYRPCGHLNPLLNCSLSSLWKTL